MLIDTLLDGLSQLEGGYINNSADKGGETNHGVTVAVARAFGYTGDMKDLPEKTARDIFSQLYWTQPKFDQVAQISAEIASELFDTGVNMGQSVASKFLQRALNTLNMMEKFYSDIAVDGQIGSLTLYALRSYLQNRGASDGVKVLLKMLNAQQSVRYMEIAEANKSQEAFEFGWQKNRVTM